MFEPPIMSVNNIIIGQTYVDISGKSSLINLNKSGERVDLEFFHRASSAKNAFKVQGEVKNQLGEVEYTIEGRWNDKIYLVSNVNGEEVRELVFQKIPYPDKYEFMYGMTQHSLQLNYFPSWLQNQVGPNDSRRRPDQRNLELGEMKKAAEEKTRLEEKQRKVRNYKEKNKIKHKTVYFDEEMVEEDQQIYWKYNSTYFE